MAKISNKNYHIDLTCKHNCINYLSKCNHCYYKDKKNTESQFKPRGVKCL